MMKNIKNNIFRHLAAVVLLLGVALSFTGCYETEPPMITVSKSIVRIDQQAQSVTVTVTSNSEWSVKSDADWCIPSTSKGRGTADVDFVISRCDSSSDRQAVITFTTLGANQTQATLTISQSAINCLLQISPDAIAVGNEATSVTFAIASNTAWTLSPTADWITPSVKQGVGNTLVRLAIAENTSHNEDRTAQVEVIVGTDNDRVVESLTVTQSSRSLPSIVLSHNALMFSALAKSEGTGKRTIDVVTNITGAITVSSQFSWCNASYIDGKVTISVDDNSANEARNAIVNVIGDVNGTAVVKQIIVSQAGVGSPLVTMVKDQVFVNANDGTGNKNAKIPVAVGFYPSNSSIKVTVLDDAPQWISDVELTTNLLTFNVDVNQLPKERTATVTLVAKIGEETLFYPVTVVQMAEQELNLIASANYSNLRSYADTAVIALFSRVGNAKFIAYTADGEWCKAEITQMTNGKDANAFLVITAEANETSTARNANVVVVAQSADQRAYVNVTVSQNGVGGPEVNLIENEIILPVEAIAKSELYKVNVDGIDKSTNVKLESSQNWVKATLSSDKDAILFTTETNFSSYARNAVVTMIASKGDQQQILSIGVTQLGTGSAEILFESLEYRFAAYGTKSYFIPAEPKNGTEYTILNAEEWIKAEKTDGGLTLTISQNPSSEERIGSVILFATNGSDSRYYTVTVTQDGIGDPDLRAIIQNITVENTEFNFSPVRNRVRIITDGDEFTSLETTQEVSWLDSRMSEDKRFVELRATRNDNVESRSAVVTIIGNRGGSVKTASFNVTQIGTGDPGLIFPMDEYFFNADGVSTYAGYNGYVGTPITFTVLNGSTWHSFGVPMIEAKPDWVESVIVDTYYSDQNRGRVWVNVKPNYNANSRSGELTFRVVRGGKTIFQSIVLTQAGLGGPALIPARTNITLARYENTIWTPNKVTLLVSGLKDKDLFVSDSYTNANWFKVEQLNNDNDSLVFIATKANTAVNSRTEAFYLKVMKGGQEQVIAIDVTQAGTGSPSLTFANDTYYYTASGHPTIDSKFPYSASDIHFTAVNNAQYEVASKPSWVHVEKGLNFYGISISVDANQKAESRQGEIVFRVYNEGQDETIFQSITIVQNGIGGPNLVAARTDVTLSQNKHSHKNPNTIAIPVTGLDDKDLRTDASYDNFDWFKATVDKDHNKVYFEATQANEGTESRTGYYHLKVGKGGQEQTIAFTVTQLGTGEPGLLFGVDEYFFTAEGHSPYSDSYQKVSVIYTALNQSVASIVETPQWIDFSVDDFGHFKIWAKSKNEDAQARSGVVVFKVDNSADPDKSIYQTISVVQLGVGGPELVAARTEIDINQNGDEVQIPVAGLHDENLVTEESYTNADWLTATIHDHREFISFKASKNTSVESRTAYYHLKVIKGGQEQIISFKVIQSGTGAPGIVFPVSEFTLPAPDNTNAPLYVHYHLLNMSSVDEITVFEAPNWLHIIGEPTYNSTSQTGYIKVSASANKTNEERTGVVTFRVANAAEGADSYIFQSVTITQLGLDAPQVRVALNDIVLQAEQGDVVTISATGLKDADLKVNTPVTNVNWLEVNVRQNDNRIEFKSTQPNGTAKVRTADVSFTVTKGTKNQILTFAVSQLAAGSPSILFSQNEYVFNPDGSSNYSSYDKTSGKTAVSFTVKNSAQWNVVENPAWVTVEVAGNSILVKPATNNDDLKRSDRITFLVSTPAGDEQIYQSIIVTQLGHSAPNLIPASTTITLGQSKNSTFTLDVKNLKIDQQSISGSSTESWFGVDLATNLDNNQIIFTANSANQNVENRTGIYKLVAERGGQEQIIEFTVIQLGTGAPSLLFAADQYYYTSNGGEKTIYFVVNNNAQWKIDSQPDWITNISNNADNIQFTLADNTASNSRTGEIVFRVYNSNAKDVEIFQKVTLTQSGVGGPNINPAYTEVTFASNKKDETVLVPITGIADVTKDAASYTNQDWIGAEIVEGEGIRFTADKANTSEAERHGHYTLTVKKGTEYQTVSFSITQPGTGSPSLIFASDRYYVAASNNSTTFNVHFTRVNDALIQVYTNDSWIHIGSATDTRQPLTIDSYNLAEERTGTVTFRVYNEGRDAFIFQTISVVQSGVGGPEVVPAYYDVVLGNANGSSVEVPVTGLTTDINFGSYTTANWFTGTVANGKVTFTAKSQNENADARNDVYFIKVRKGSVNQIVTINVSQMGTGDPSLTFANDDLYYGSEENSAPYFIPVTVNNSANYQIVNYPDFVKSVSGEQNPETVRLYLNANTSSADRSGVISFKVWNAGGDKVIYQNVTIHQAGQGGPNVNVPYYDVTISNKNAAKSVKIPYTGKGNVVAKTEHADWFVTGVDATGKYLTFNAVDGKFNTSVAKRTAKAVFEVTQGDQKQLITINVTQSGTGSPELIFASDDYSYIAAGKTDAVINFTKVNGANYDVVSVPDFITAKSKNNDNLVIDVAANDKAVSRNGAIVFKVWNTGGDEVLFQSVAVSQSGVGGLNVEPAFTDVVLMQKAHSADAYNNVKVPTIGLGDVTIKSVVSNAQWLPVTNSANYEAYDSKTCVFVNKSAGEIEFVGRQANAGSASRSCTVYVTLEKGGEEQTYSFNVTQLGKGDPTVSFAASDYKFGPSAVNANIQYSASNNAEVSLVSKPLYATVSSNDGYFTLSMPANVSSDDRSGVVTFKAVSGEKTVYQTVTFTQAGVGGPEVNLAYYDVTISNLSTSNTIKIPYTGNAVPAVYGGHASWFNATVNNGYIEIAPTSGNFNKSATSRTASLVLRAIKGTRAQLITVNVTQPGTAAPALEISNSDVKFLSQAKSLDTYVLLKNVTLVKVIPSESWINVDSYSLTSSRTLSIHVSANSSTVDRNGTVVLIASNSGDQKTMYTINVLQKGVGSANVIAALDQIEVPSSGFGDGTTNSAFGVMLSDVDGTLSVVSSASWLTSVIDGEMVRFTQIEANETGAAREAYLTVKATKTAGTAATAVIKVTQPAASAPQIVIPANMFVFGSNESGSSSKITIPVSTVNATADDVKMTNNADWLYVKYNNGKLVITPSSDNSGQERSTLVTLRISTASKEVLQTIIVVQKAEPVTEKIEFKSSASGEGWSFDASTATLTISDATKSYDKISIPVTVNTLARVYTVSPLSTSFKWRYSRPAKAFATVSTTADKDTRQITYNSEKVVNAPTRVSIPYVLNGKANFSTGADGADFVNGFLGSFKHTVYVESLNPSAKVDQIGFAYPATASGSGVTSYSYYYDKYAEDDFQYVDNYHTWIGFNAESKYVEKVLNNTNGGSTLFNLSNKVEYYQWSWNNSLMIVVPNTGKDYVQTLDIAIWRNPYGSARTGYIIIDTGDGVTKSITVVQPAHKDKSDVKNGYIQYFSETESGNTESYDRETL